jgi:acyl-homoserine lactone acylase PvdQ
MVEDKDDDKRRAKISRQLLAEMHNVSFEDLQEQAFDTTLYWAQQELPIYAGELEQLKIADPELAAQAAPLFDHLRNWDCKVTATSTEATLCTAWYVELYGEVYPGETLKPRFAEDRSTHWKALVAAANGLRSVHGRWQVPWGEIYRAQRHPNVVDLLDMPFDDRLPSLPCLGGHGPMGIVLTQYYSPSINIPFIKSVKKRYGLVGATYLGVFEFGPKVRGATLLNFGQSGDPLSPHYFDQAKLLSQGRCKPELFDWDEVKAAATRSYHPGDPSRLARSAVAE